MKRKKNIELMAPAGSFSTLITALNAGADAVYFGISDFSMRSGKKNFKLNDLEKINKICNSYSQKPKKYLTLNTIVYDKEQKKLEKIVKKVKGVVDAIICSDFAVIKLCKDNKIPFIISTQCSISNTASALFYKKLGAKRVVLARELDIKQIKEISKVKGLEIEVFAHGAMCVAVSGRCFMSQFLYNKSANRGECLHPCRRGYEVFDKDTNKKLHLYNNTVMSAKDLCTLPFLEELKKANISAIKIEGRNRDERYIDTVVRAYRKAIDTKLKTEELITLMGEIEKVFHRGFSSGFYLKKPLPQDFATVENSASSTFRDYIGNVTHFYPKINVALISLKKELKISDNIIFISPSIGLRELRVEEMEINKKKIKLAKKGNEIGIKVDFNLKKGDEVYKIITKKKQP